MFKIWSEVERKKAHREDQRYQKYYQICHITFILIKVNFLLNVKKRVLVLGNLKLTPQMGRIDDRSEKSLFLPRVNLITN